MKSAYCSICVSPFGGDRDDTAAAGLDLLNIADDFVVLAALGRDEDDGHALIDQRDRAVLHLGGGHALGVDVADFFEFERAFERDGIRVASAEEQPVVAVHHLFHRVADHVRLLTMVAMWSGICCS